LPCQDSSLAELVDNGNTVICALSDGAGSAKYAEEASMTQVEEVVQYFRCILFDHPNPIELIKEFDVTDGIKVLDEIRQKLSELSKANGVKINDYSATLLFGIINKECSVFYQVGDGCWVIKKNNIYCAVTQPTQGEFVGQTVFVSSSNYSQEIQFEKIPFSIDAIIGFTDGIERLALDIKNNAPHYQFFNPIVESFIQEENRKSFEERISSFLNSERVCDRTDDDKTIVLIAQ